MQDRPTAAELLAAVREHLESAVIPAIRDPKLRFQTLVCANVVGIVEREIASEERVLRAEWDGLAELLGPAPRPPDSLEALRKETAGRTRELCRQIRAGTWDAGEGYKPALGHIRRVVRAKLAVANPRYASVASVTKR
jgi:hypothetical protein